MDRATETGYGTEAPAETVTPKAPSPPVQLAASRARAGQSADIRSALGGSAAMPGLLQFAGGRAAENIHAAASHGVSGPGGPLPHLDTIQKSFGRHDVSNVQAHTGGRAKQANETIGSMAFATGDQVAFRESPDLHTAAHEAAHSVQQRTGVHLKGGVGREGDPYERHADAVADAVVAGRSAEPILDAMPGGSGGGKGVQPKTSREPTVEEMANALSQRLIAARAQGAQAVVAEVRSLRASAADSPNGKQALEQAISRTLNQEEKDLLAGKSTKSGGGDKGSTGGDAKGGDGSATGTSGADGGNGTPDSGAKAKGGDATGGDKGSSGKGGGKGGTGELSNGDAPSDGTADGKDGDGKGDGKDGKGDGKGGDGKGADGKGAGKGADGKGDGKGAAPAAGGKGAGQTTPAPPTKAQALKPVAPIPADKRGLVEQELAFHENWKALKGGAGARALHLAKGLGNDLVQGGKGAGRQVAGGLAAQFLGKAFPGAGNVIGGALSAHWLTQGGGAAAITDLQEGWQALTDPNMGPMQRLADIVQMVKSMLDLVGNVCNILSGLAYGFAAIAAIGGLLSVFFPPLAFLVPYIPTAINFGRMAGGVAQVCIGISNVISPIPPAFRALHIITSNDDPIKLVGQEQQYHSELQGAIANYGSAAIGGAMSARSKAKAQGKTGKAVNAATAKGANPFKEFKSSIKSGASSTKSGYKDLKAGNVKAKEAVGVSGKSNKEQRADGKNTGENYLKGKDMTSKGPTGAKAKETQAQLKATKAEMKAKQQELAQAQKKLDQVKSEYPKYNASKPGKKGGKPKHWPNKGKNKQARYNNERAQKIGEAKKSVSKAENDSAALKQKHDDLTGARTTQRQHQKDIREIGLGRGQGEVGAGVDNAWNASNSTQEKQPDGQQQQPKIEKDEKGHVKLPSPPHDMASIDAFDKDIGQMQQKLSAQQDNTQAAKTHEQDATKTAGDLDQIKGGIDGKKGELDSKKAGHDKAAQQNADAKGKQSQNAGSTDQGMTKAANALKPIAGPMRTVNSVVQKVPSNRFFNVSGTKKNLGEMTKAVNEITGADGKKKSEAGKADQVIAGREKTVAKAGAKHADNKSGTAEFGTKVAGDADKARAVAQDSGKQAQQSQKAEKTLEQQIEEKKKQKAEQFAAMMSWAGSHYTIRSSVK